MKLRPWLAVTASAAALVLTAGGSSASAAAQYHSHTHPAVHVSLHGRVAADPNNVTQLGSTNWAGYIALPKSAHGTFPDVDEQDGITAQCQGTTPVYSAWFEMFPLGTVASTLTVSPGDAMQASVAYASGNYTLTLTDITTGLQQIYNSACPSGSTCKNSSAEVISEAPFGTSVLPLADFGMENFDNVTISDRSQQAGGFTDGNWKDAQIVQVNAGGTTTLDAPGALYGGRAFDDQWLGES
jgi:hypothetical protein